jgi:phospholipase C
MQRKTSCAVAKADRQHHKEQTRMATKSSKSSKKRATKKRAATKSQKHAPSRKASAARKTGKRAVKRQVRAAAAPTAFVSVAADPALSNLDKIEHIVVLMMENRSFDHILGYLTLENGRTDVDGLAAGMANNDGSKNYPIHLLSETAWQKGQDPCHDGDCVDQQLANGNSGFVINYEATHKQDAADGLVMGYYNGTVLNVYDHLARNFLICDRWFCSLPGSTWPNRLYSVTGRADGSRVNKGVPIYDLPSFVRYLEASNVSWRWYAHNVSSLRLIDSQYRQPLHMKFAHFSGFDHNTPLGGNSFLADAAQGKLASVSWIDPDFGDADPLHLTRANDDHPPTDIARGQELALKLYNAVINSPQWEKTLLVVVYDEHGGIFDHVSPPPAPDDSNDPAFHRYGVRVPAFIVSPWVERGRCDHTVFDHTSLIKTILLKFCRRADGSIPDMGARVTNANHLGGLLTLQTPRPAPPLAAFQHLIAHIAELKSANFAKTMSMQAHGVVAPPPKPNELQQGVTAAKRELRIRGLPEGQL